MRWLFIAAVIGLVASTAFFLRSAIVEPTGQASPVALDRQNASSSPPRQGMSPKAGSANVPSGGQAAPHTTDARRTTAAAGTTPVAAPRPGTPAASSAEQEAWKQAVVSSNFVAYRTFLKAHPSGGYRTKALAAAHKLLQSRVGEMLDNAIKTARERNDQPIKYVRARDPRALAMCIDWTATTLKAIAWRSIGSGLRLGLSQENREKGAIAQCKRKQPAGTHCTCAIVHVNGKNNAVLPASWIDAQLK